MQAQRYLSSRCVARVCITVGAHSGEHHQAYCTTPNANITTHAPAIVCIEGVLKVRSEHSSRQAACSDVQAGAQHRNLRQFACEAEGLDLLQTLATGKQAGQV
jgi:hypothetical protein